jgi:PKD repeat protein
MTFSKTFLSFAIFMALAFHGQSQVNYNANDSATVYNGLFRLGYNPSFAAGWSDLGFANLAAGNPAVYSKGVGCSSIRTGFFFEKFNTWGFNTKHSELDHYKSLGMRDFSALLLGGNMGADQSPSQQYRDQNFYCPGTQSELFANLYTPIWDNGANGTPYNDTNYFAVYLYKTVSEYKDDVQYWEIWNEPGFDFSGNHGWRKSGDPEGNWWDADPNPCDYKLHAPVQHYVRMLRIAWDIVKTLDPTGFVCMGAPGFPSFVDAVTRNTDNPNGGGVTAEYPLKGGAYFDCVCYHSFPHFDEGMRVSDDPLKYKRNSDQAAASTINLKRKFEDVLKGKGYDGITYPKKHFIITEINLPRKIFYYTLGNYGSGIAQRNFMMKAYINCKIEGIHQMNPYTISELRPENVASWEFDLMGLYENLDNKTYETATRTEEGVGLMAVSHFLTNTTHDPVKSAALKQDSTTRIEAFKKSDGTYIYVLWAVMNFDFSETGFGQYSFPANSGVSQFLKKNIWSYGITEETFITGNHEIQLDGSPIFLTEMPATTQAMPDFSASQMVGCIPFTVQYTNLSQNATNYVWQFPGGTPSTTTATNPLVTYIEPGYHAAMLTAKNATSSNVNAQYYLVRARQIPQASFVPIVNGPTSFFLNGTNDGDDYFWIFGDGETSNEPFPAHSYEHGGTYSVSLIAQNPCGIDTFTQLVTVFEPLLAAFTADVTRGCDSLTVHFLANEPTAVAFNWFFEGGVPSQSYSPFPTVRFPNTGSFGVALTVGNGDYYGTNTIEDFIRISHPPSALFTYEKTGNSIVFNNQSEGDTFFWDFGDGNTSTEVSPTHTYNALGGYVVRLLSINYCDTAIYTEVVQPLQIPTAHISIQNTEGCAPFTAQYTSDGMGLTTSVHWLFTGGIPSESNEVNPTVIYPEAGVYPVQLIVGNDAGNDTLFMPFALTVNEIAMADFSFDTNLDTAFFQNNSTADNATYLWDFGDGTTSTAANPLHIYSDAGLYNVNLTVTNICSQDSVSTVVLVVFEKPTSGFSSNVISGCAPLQIQFQDQSAGDPNVWKWSFPGGQPLTSNLQNPSVIYSIPGQYNVRLITLNPYGSDTLSLASLISVLPRPQSNFGVQIAQNQVIVNNISNNATSYLWNFGDGTTDITTNPTHIYTSTGTYTITLIALNECASDTSLFSFEILSVAVNDLDKNNIFKVFPNPNNGAFQIVWNVSNLNDEKIREISLVNAVGTTVFQREVKSVSNQVTEQVDVKNLPSGVYWLEVKGDNFVVGKAVVIGR